MTPILEVQDLTFRYTGRKRPALRHVSLRLERGESLLVLGPSGGGKSTLALCLNGAIPHFVDGELTGRVEIDGRNTRTTPVAELAQKVGIVFQDPDAQFCMLVVEEEVAFGLENLAVPRDEMDARIVEALNWVGLADKRREPIERLSGGQKQRLALACVPAQRPDALVFDEPTAQLDPAGVSEVIDVLQRLRAEARHSLVIIEHRLDDVMPLVDRTLVLSQLGEVLADGPPRSVLQIHGASLAEAGIWIPQVSEVALALAARGLQVEPFPLTVQEAAQALRPHASRLTSRVIDTASAAPPHGHTVFDLRGLTYTYPGAATPAVRDIALQLHDGELTAIVGENGAGKSTLARLVAGIIRPPNGTVRLRGTDLRTLRLPEIARQVGYVFQYPEHQFVGRSVLDDVAYGLRRAGVQEAQAREQARRTLEDFGLAELAPAHPFTLSGGEQRRLSVAAMLVLGQQALFLDEPTFGQDRRSAGQLLDKLSHLAEAGRCIVAITHDMRLVAERASRTVAMADGTIVFEGPPRALFSRSEVLTRARLRPPPVWQLGEALGLSEPPLRVEEFAPRLGRTEVATQ
jgi:energy-coupling factor transporter ATP-binding protein EcfA2